MPARLRSSGYCPSNQYLALQGRAVRALKLGLRSTGFVWCMRSWYENYIILVLFGFEICRHQWTVPVLDGTPATAMVFHPGSTNVLIVSSAANQIHALDVEVKAPGEWSKRNGARIAHKMQDFPGSIIGLSLPSTPTSTSIIAYSSRYSRTAESIIAFTRDWFYSQLSVIPECLFHLTERSTVYSRNICWSAVRCVISTSANLLGMKLKGCRKIQLVKRSLVMGKCMLV